ncbi:AAA family ATPase [uncultured Pseudokineococcus sp.]|uniref:AAA family ATPase n=1 Tax=uncultured Pseudokineococcus sp. TaxID=1642928 RepID=UPI00260849D6|nr:AAA family ATPase [uncultured Pseudokineococcus sp.]
MRLLRLRLESFRGIAEHEVELSPTGVTVVVGDNEIGKTSLVDALDMLLDQYDSSKRKWVAATQPVGQDVPTLVEAEVRAGRYRFTYRKQFHRQPSTRLVVHEPAPEQLAGREAHDRALAILGEEVDLPLWRALRLQQGVPLDQADLEARTSLASALDATVAESVGGEREETLVARAEEEFGRYWTPTGAVRTEGRALAGEVEEGARRVGALEAAVAEVERVVDALGRVRADAVAERAAGERDAAALAQADARVEALHEVVRDAERARAGLHAASSAHALAEQRAAARASAAARAVELAAEVGERTGAAEVAGEDEREARERLAAAGAVLDAALEEQAGWRETRLRAARAEERAREAAEVERLRGLVDRHETALAAVTTAEAVLAGHRVDDEGLAEVESLHRTWAAASARAGSAAPVVLLRGAGERVVTSDGEHVVGEDPLELRLGGGTWFEVGGVRVEGRPTPDQERAEADERRSAAALAGACRDLGVEGLEGAMAAAHARRAAQGEQDRARAALRDLVAGSDPETARRRVARWDEARASEDEGDGAGGLPSGSGDDAWSARAVTAARALREADEGASAAGERVATATSRHEGARAALDLAERRLAEARAAVDAAAARRELVEEDLQREREEVGDEALLGGVTAAAEELAAARQRRELAAEAVREAGVEGAEAEAEVARQRRDDGRKRLRSLEDEAGALAAVLEARGGEGLVEDLAAARAAHERARRALTSWERRAAAARTLRDALDAARREAHLAYVEPLRAQLQRLAAHVFGADVRVDVGPDLRITSRTLGGVTVPFEQLSSGAREQLAVLGRLACAMLVSGGAGVPVLLDDALGYSDPRRLDGMARALAAAGESCQVVVLTCVPERYRLVAGASTQRLRG